MLGALNSVDGPERRAFEASAIVNFEVAGGQHDGVNILTTHAKSADCNAVDSWRAHAGAANGDSLQRSA